MKIIELQKMGKTYHDDQVETVALRDISFHISKGEFVAIMGPSGSGKSTLLHVLGFLDKHTSGSYIFEGKKSGEYTEIEMALIRNKKMGFIFQTFNLLPRTTVLENVKLPLLYSNIPEKDWNVKAAKALHDVGMGHRLDFEPSQLSGGEKQRVAIARALVNDPEVIFADEPTGNLDSKSGQMVMKTIQTLNERDGHTIVLITHETYTAEHAERIIKIYDGQVQSDTKVGTERKSADEFEK